MRRSNMALFGDANKFAQAGSRPWTPSRDPQVKVSVAAETFDHRPKRAFLTRPEQTPLRCACSTRRIRKLIPNRRFTSTG